MTAKEFYKKWKNELLCFQRILPDTEPDSTMREEFIEDVYELSKWEKDVNKDFVNPFQNAGGGVQPIPEGLFFGDEKASPETTGSVLPFTYAEYDEYIKKTYAHNREHCMDSMRRVAEWVTWKFTGKSPTLSRLENSRKEQEDLITSTFEKPVSKVDKLTEATVNEFVDQMRRSPVLVRDEAKVNQTGDFIEDDETKWWVGMTPRCVWGVDINPNLREVIKAFKVSGSQTVYLVYDNWTIARVPENPNSKDSAILEYPDPIPQPEPKLITEKQAEELSRVKNYVREQLRKGDGGKVYHEEDTPMNPEYDREAVRQVGIKRDEDAKKEIRGKDMRHQQEKYERWWKGMIPVEIDGKEINPNKRRVIAVIYRKDWNGKGTVDMVLYDASIYQVDAPGYSRNPKKSQVKLLEEENG